MRLMMPIGGLCIGLLACNADDPGSEQPHESVDPPSEVLPSTEALGLGRFDEHIGDDQLFAEGAGDRVWRDVVYDTTWLYGGPQDTLLAEPLRIAAAPGGGVYVLDAGIKKVYRFQNGDIVWSWGSIGRGPGEIQNVRAMDADPETGGVVLVDSGNRRLILLSADGALLQEVRVADRSPLFPTVAGLGFGRGYVVGTATVAFPAMHIASDGESFQRIAAPWDGFLAKNFLQVAGKVFRGVQGGWGFAFETGNGWFIYESTSDDTPLSHPYVEHVEFPQLVTSQSSEGGSVRMSAGFATRPVYSGYDVAVKADTFFVLPGGSVNRQALDVYNVADGRYIETRPLPGRFTRFALAGDTVFLIDRRGLYPVILALHPKERRQ